MTNHHKIESHFTHRRKRSRFLNKGFTSDDPLSALTPKKDLLNDFSEASKTPKEGSFNYTPNEQKHVRQISEI